MADWGAFAESFLNRTAEGIRERTADAKSYEERQRELARTTGRAEFKKRTGLAQTLGGLGSKAKSLGATDAMVAAAIDAGPTGLVDLTKNLSELKTSLGARWTPEAAQNNFEVPEAYGVMKYEPDWMTKRIRSTVGLSDPTVGDYKAKDYGMIGNLFGFNARENARVNLDSELGVGGYSMLDLNELSAQSEYEALTQGSYVNFTPLKYFDALNATDEASTLQLTFKRSFAADNNWDALETKIGFAEDVIANEGMFYTDINGNELSGNKAKVAAREELSLLKAQQRAVEKTIATQIVSSRASAYTGGGYLESMKAFLTPYGIDIDALNEEIYNFAALDEDDVSDDGKTPPASGAVNAERNNVVVVEQDDTSLTYEGESLGLADDNRYIFSTETHDDGVPKTVTLKVNDTTVVISNKEDVKILKDEAEGNTRITAGEEFDLTNVGVDFSNTPRGEMPQLDPRTMTEEEFDDLSRSQKAAAGLPVSPLGDWLTNHASPEERDARLAMIELKRNADPDAFYKISVKGINLNRPMRVKGSNLKYIPDAVIVRGYNNTTIEQFGVDEDLPKKEFSKNKMIRSYNTEDAQAQVRLLNEEIDVTSTPGTRPVKRPDGTTEEPTQDEADEQVVKASKPLEEFVTGFGRDMVLYLVQNGYASDDDTDDIREGISMWFNDNAAKASSMPQIDNIDGLTYLMKQALQRVQPDLSDNPEV